MKTIADLAKIVQGNLVGDPHIEIKGITNIENPLSGHIAFAQNEKSIHRLEETEIAAIIAPLSVSKSIKPLIQVKDPKLAWALLLADFYPSCKPVPGIAQEASIAKTAKIGMNVTIEPFARVSNHAVISDGAILRSHSFVGENVSIGSNTILHPGVIIYHNCVIGASVILHAGVVIGADGFGYVATANGQIKVPQVGNVIIEDEVELGANVTIDRATVGSTKIGKGTKIDNLVQIGHNVAIGSHTVISAQTGISGSSKIGSYVTMGGKVGVGDHVEIGDWVMVGAGAGFPSGKKVPSRQIVFGEPARPYQEARRQIAAQLRSAETLDELRKLRQRVTELEKMIEKLNGKTTA